MRMHYGGMGGYGGYPAGYPGTGYEQQQYHQQFPANNYPNFNGPSQQQQQPHDAYNGGIGQWSGWEQQQQQWMQQSGSGGGNMDWSNWGAGRPASRHQAHMSPPQQHAAHMSPPQHPSQQPQQPTTTTANNNNNSDSYLRTLQYVKNCQSWSSNSGVGSPPDYNQQQQQQQQQSAVPQSKKPAKTSPAHNPASMPPPTTTGIVPSMHMAAGLQMGPGNNMLGAGMPHGSGMGMGGGHKPNENMVLGDMHSSMNALMEENRYLQMMQ